MGYLKRNSACKLSSFGHEQYPFSFNRYVMEPKQFLIYPKKGFAHALSNFRHKQYPSNSLNQNNLIHDVYRIPSWGYYFLGLNNLFLGEKKVFWFECKTIIIFLIISSNIHIRIFDNVFLTINTRWCKMKVKCLKLKKWVTSATKMCKKWPSSNPTLKWRTCHQSKYVVAWKINCFPKSWRPKQHLNQN